MEQILNSIKDNNYNCNVNHRSYWNNKESVLEVAKNNVHYLLHTSYELQSNKKFMLEAVKKDGRALKYASCNIIILKNHSIKF